MDKQARWLLIGAVMAGTGVAVGAFGAHGLQRVLPATDAPGLLATWEVGVRYQMYHALALVTLALGPGALWNARSMIVTAWCYLLGSAVFSGSLYLLVLSGQKWLGAITPLGGLLLIAGWCALGISAFRLGAAAHHT